MTDAASDLAALFPGREVVCKGETIRIVPLYFGQYPQAGKLAKPLINALREANLFAFANVIEDGKTVAKFELAENWIAELPMVLDEGGEALIRFFAFAIGKPREWFDTLAGDEGIALGQAIFEENADFFVRRILPMLQTAGFTKADGAASSPASTALDTAGMPSSA